MKFIIYHIPGVKVGCTTDIDSRVGLSIKLNGRLNDYSSVEILEELENCTEEYAGDREWYWADKLGYKRGLHYSKSRNSIKLAQVLGGRVTGKLHKKNSTGVFDPTHRERITKLGGTATKDKQLGIFTPGSHKKHGEVAARNNTGSFKLITCPHCNKTGPLMSMKRHHFDRCKLKRTY